ncbi:15-cis-phytoene synthase CrtB [Phormidium tenue]|uniref:15-cis-phytoene synthase n=1 Tax=Phormidium tenue NIES-30 TaxID=549789 RepID=A0A1U7J1T5_9CYAN|nr:phytoene synthase [Phormidium tenue]MBD2232155.1 phytoene synthase [Phormidium tenue FACHB-1052]OKH45897.1 phytoene synthase [Phormidium tenue NIES-30]
MLQLTDSPPIQSLSSVEDAYEVCRRVTAKYSKTFYTGTMLMAPAKRRAIWAIYVWCRRTDELVDGPQAQFTSEKTLDRWESQLESIFAGCPVDDEDVALVDTLEQFPLDIQPFRDMIAGQRMDLHRNRYDTFEDLELYCYRVAGTVGLMSTTVMGVDTQLQTAPWSQQQQLDPTPQAIALGIANQLTNILRDVGEDARRGRIYLPLKDLAAFDYTEADLVAGVVDDRWRALMAFQIDRARRFYAEAESGIGLLSEDARWPVWCALALYRQILDVIEKNGYDVFSQRAYVPSLRKLLTLPSTLVKARVL